MEVEIVVDLLMSENHMVTGTLILNINKRGILGV
jgi:hypothetical protein